MKFLFIAHMTHHTAIGESAFLAHIHIVITGFKFV